MGTLVLIARQRARSDRKSVNTKDRRVHRTRRILRDALVNLILERGWDAISVLDICERADIGRSTFYAHFADKEELLLSGFDDLRRWVRQEIQRQEASQPGANAYRPGQMSFARPILEHARENIQLFRALLDKRSGAAVHREFRQVVLEFVQEEVRAFAPSASSTETIVHYIAGAFLELLTWSLMTTGAQSPSPEDLAVALQRLTQPVLSTLHECNSPPA